MASARIGKGFKYHVWPKNNEVEHTTIFIYLFIYWIPPYNTWDLMSFFLNTEAELKLVKSEYVTHLNLVGHYLHSEKSNY